MLSTQQAKQSQPLALPLDRIAIVGASVSSGFGGTPFGEAFTDAAPHSAVESEADLLLFRDPIGNARAQIDAAIAFRATCVVAIDLLFWQVYNFTDGGALEIVLGELERARATGAWILVGDVPRVTTASELLIPRDAVPAPELLEARNAVIAAWAAHRERVLVVPFAAWVAPLASDGDVELAPGERVAARTLVAPDGLHANPLGTWALLDRLDHFIEAKLPGTPHGALVFVRPR